VSAYRSALYLGRVGHLRLRPKRHVLGYRSFMLLLDLDELDALDRSLRWFSARRFNLFGFRERDHGDASATPLREQVAAHLRAAGIDQSLGSVQLLCLPRMIGYVFNPLSLYFCHGVEGELLAILYEVSSTFGERHTYFAPVQGDARPVVQTARKRLHVSPFMSMDQSYDFCVEPPGERVRIGVASRDGNGPILQASFVGRREPLSDASLIRTFASHPFQTAAVMAAIHWEAVKLLAKGVRLRAGPPAPREPVSYGEALQPSRR
jgi:uncharacterized protein